MPTINQDGHQFIGISLVGAQSAIGQGFTNVQTTSFVLTNYTFSNALSGNETTAANIAKVLSTLIQTLKHNGTIK
jgi:hypothetical protein